MQMILSSAALPDESLDMLRRGTRRRDLAGLELVLGAGLDPSGQLGPDAAAKAAPEPGTPPVRWVLGPDGAGDAEVMYWGQQAHLLDAGLLLRHPVSASPVGVPLAVLHGTDPTEAQRAAAWARMHGASTGWTVRLHQDDPDELSSTLDVTAPALAHVRLMGAGPEAQSAAPGTTATGTVLKELALRGYDGTVALAPSPDGSTDAWRRWLFEERGWGCNTVAKKKEERAATS